MNKEQFKEKREGLNHSQESLAKALGVHRGSVLRWERGDFRIPHAIAMAMRVVPRRDKPVLRAGSSAGVPSGHPRHT